MGPSPTPAPPRPPIVGGRRNRLRHQAEALTNQSLSALCRSVPQRIPRIHWDACTRVVVGPGLQQVAPCVEYAGVRDLPAFTAALRGTASLNLFLIATLVAPPRATCLTLPLRPVLAGTLAIRK